jgi:hypothetical protein
MKIQKLDITDTMSNIVTHLCNCTPLWCLLYYAADCLLDSSIGIYCTTVLYCTSLSETYGFPFWRLLDTSFVST